MLDSTMGESSHGKKGPEAGAGFLEAESPFPESAERSTGAEACEAEASEAEASEAEASGAETPELAFFISAPSEHRGSAANTPPSGNFSG